jgi:transposase
MDPTEMALFSRVFHLPAGIAITSVHPSASELVMGVACQAASMPCPECHQPSARLHGHYQRTVADLPCAGRTVILALTVRKFVCSTPGCTRSIFDLSAPGAGAVLCPDDQQTHRVPASAWVGDRWTDGHATG